MQQLSFYLLRVVYKESGELEAKDEEINLGTKTWLHDKLNWNQHIPLENNDFKAGCGADLIQIRNIAQDKL